MESHYLYYGISPEGCGADKGKNGKNLPGDVKALVLALIKGYDARRKRYAETGLEFDLAAIEAVEQSAFALGEDIADAGVRELLRKKVIRSICDRTPYRLLGECYCGENKFYAYRKELCRSVAKRMGLL